MDEVFSVKTNGNGYLVLFVNGEECDAVKVKNDSEQAFLEGVLELLGEGGSNLHTYLY